MAHEIGTNHPRRESLERRYRLEKAAQQGLLAGTAMIAHGRGEAFDYLLGEQTTAPARAATEQAVALLTAATNPVISMNGNTAVLSGRALLECAALLSCSVEVNIFYRTPERITALIELLKTEQARSATEQPLGWKGNVQEWATAVCDVPILGANNDATIPGLEGPRAHCESVGILSADVVLIPLEDGDRCEALVELGKQVIVVDLNPLSRSAKLASITIVDEVSRFASNLQNILLTESPLVDGEWNNTACLQESLKLIANRFMTTP